MSEQEVQALRERAKELLCLYAIDEILGDRGQPPVRAFTRILEAIPPGWQRPHATGGRIVYLGRHYVGSRFSASGACISQPLQLWGVDVGRVDVSDERDARDGAPAFLAEETELLRRIARRIEQYLEWKHAELMGERGPVVSSHWAWRQRFAESLSRQMDATRFGVSHVFLGGSTASGDAGPGSDIDLYVVFMGSERQRVERAAWLEGWSLCLAEVSVQQTGHPFPGGIIEVHWLREPPRLSRYPELRELVVGGRSRTSARKHEE